MPALQVAPAGSAAGHLLIPLCTRLLRYRDPPRWIKYLMCYADVFMILLLVGGVLCFVAFSIDQSDLTNLYLGVVLFLVVFLSGVYQLSSNNLGTA